MSSFASREASLLVKCSLHFRSNSVNNKSENRPPASGVYRGRQRSLIFYRTVSVDAHLLYANQPVLAPAIFFLNILSIVETASSITSTSSFPSLSQRPQSRKSAQSDIDTFLVWFQYLLFVVRSCQDGIGLRSRNKHCSKIIWFVHLRDVA